MVYFDGSGFESRAVFSSWLRLRSQFRVIFDTCFRLRLGACADGRRMTSSALTVLSLAPGRPFFTPVGLWMCTANPVTQSSFVRAQEQACAQSMPKPTQYQSPPLAVPIHGVLPFFSGLGIGFVFGFGLEPFLEYGFGFGFGFALLLLQWVSASASCHCHGFEPSAFRLIFGTTIMCCFKIIVRSTVNYLQECFFKKKKKEAEAELSTKCWGCI